MNRLYYAAAILAATILAVALIAFVVTAPPAHNLFSPNSHNPSLPDSKYRDLVKQLVSPNAEPSRNSSGQLKYPNRYDASVQQKISDARHELQDHIEEALPYLVEALDDKRYCMTIIWAEGDGVYNRSVGQICREIIESHLEVYRGKIPVRSPHHWHRYDYEPISKQWWEARNDKSLVDLQVEAVDWAIATRKYDDVPRETDTRESEIAALTKLRDEIAESQTPVKPSRLSPMTTTEWRSH
jgi:hypothetical protein